MGLRKSDGLPSVKYVYWEGNPPTPLPKKTKKQKEVRRKKEHRLVQL
jgi:hypothetical protein